MKKLALIIVFLTIGLFLQCVSVNKKIHVEDYWLYLSDSTTFRKDTGCFTRFDTIENFYLYLEKDE